MQQSEQEQQFSGWMAQHQGLIFKFVRAYAFVPVDQEDLFQEIALQLWRSIPAYQGTAKESTWIYRVALNTAITWKRNEKKHRQPKTEWPEGDLLLPTQDPVDPRLDWLYEQINRFNPIDRALVLLMLEGFSYKEMAQMLGISVSNVGVKLNRLRQQLIQRSQSISPHEL